MHKKLKIMCAAVAALSNAFAAEWFDAGISGYGQWPADGSDVVVRGEGSWSGTESAYIKGSAPAARIDFSQDGENVLVFTPAVAKSVEQSNPVVVTSVQFSSSDVPAAFSGVDKAALTVVEEEGVAHYYGLAADTVGGTNRWARLEGAAPRPGEDVELAISFAYDAGALWVRYAVDGQVLNLAGSEWIKSAPTGDGLISAVAYAGVGEIASLHATAQDAGMKTAITVPEMEGMRVASVSVGGVEVEPDESGAYVVDALSRVVVAFVPESGYVLTSRSMGFIAEGSEMAIPSEGRPQALVASETIRINEIMASNETVLNTLSGASGLDWAELRNLTSTDIDVSGWLMTDDPTKKISKWKPIEGQAIVPANGYLVVWLDSTEGRTWLLGEAHAPIGLSSGGESIALATPEGTVVSQFSFGQQLDDVSFGYGRRTRTVLGSHSVAEYRVGGATWHEVVGALGMSEAAPGFTVTTYAMNSTVSNMDDAESYIKDSSKWKAGPFTSTHSTIAFQDGDNQSNFAPYGKFPGVSGDDFVVVITGTVNVPRAGLWTFAVGSDDGFTCTLSRLGTKWMFESRGARGYGVSTGKFNLPEAGSYDVTLVYFERGGGASLDFSVAEGSKDFALADFHLVGSLESGVLHSGALGAQVAVDVTSEMVGKSQTLDWRASFDLGDGPAEGDVYRLRMRYADGFTARINGHEVASVAASGPRSASAALSYEYFAVPASVLHSGANTLEVTGYNDAVSDTEFFLSPELLVDVAAEELLYFKAPTPMAANDAQGFSGLTPKVVFSEPHGYKTGPFSLELSCPDVPNAAIYYTTDGTSPTVHSTRYTGAIPVSSTTVVRAAVPDPDTILQVDSSASYLYLSDILAAQPETVPEGFPASETVNNQKMVYGMRQNLVNGDDETKARIARGFTNSIATVSLVIDPDALFDAGQGIYVNAGNNGKLWERPLQVEQIDPVNGAANEFSVPAGIRIRGAFSRGAGYPKHSFRLFFRGEYGMSRLEFPLFGDEGTDSFKKIDFRTSQNHSWANNGGDANFIEECFSRDSQGDMGEPYNRSRFYNLFINGVYWGLYQTEERVDQHYAESYNKGDSDDYDIVRTSQPGYNTGTVEGEAASWENLWRITTQQGYGASYPNNYNRIRGLNPDGSRNPDYPTYLNETNLMVFMISTHFVADGDCPAAYGGRANNIAAFRNRVDGKGLRDGFIWNRHDAEHSLGFGTGYGDVLESFVRGTRYQLENNIHSPKSDMLALGNFNPSELHYELTLNAEYRMKFADQIYKHCLKKGGAMTAPVAEARFRSRMAEIDDVIVCEAARWGRGNQDRKYWLNNGCAGRIDFIQKRTPYLIQGYRNLGWYPSIDAPVAIAGDGTELTNGTVVASPTRAFLSASSAGTVYYTTDGSDPRLEGGEVNPSASVFSGSLPVTTTNSVAIFAKGASWDYYDWGRQPGDDTSGRAWNAESYDASSLSGDANAWASGAAPLGFKNGTTFATDLKRFENHGDSGTQVMTFYFRRKFTLPAGVDPDEIVSLSGTAWYDDGYAMYVNGVEIGRGNIGANYELSYSTGTNETGTNYVEPGDREFSFAVPKGLLHAGENVIAVEVHQCHGTSSDVAWDLSLKCDQVCEGSGEGGIAVPIDGLTVKARVLSGDGEWSALEEVLLLGTAPAGATYRVAAVMSSTADAGGDGSEFIVLTNVNAALSVDLGGVRITANKTDKAELSLDLTLPDGMSIPAGGSAFLDKATYWPSQKLTNGAVDMSVYDREGELVQTLHFEAGWWNKACDGTGAHLVALDFGEEVVEESQWKPSFRPPSVEDAKNAVAAAIAEDERIKAWMDAMGATESGQSSITEFSGGADAVKAAYLVGMDELVDPEAELKFVDIRIEDGSVRLGGDLEVLGEYWRNRVKGSLRLYRYESLGSEPSVIDLPLTDGKFPLIDATGDSTGTFRFFRLSLE